MKKHLRKIKRPDYAQLKLLAGWPVFFILFLLTENLIPAEGCRPIHCPLDDIIPFLEIFVIPYVLWYGLIAFSLVYFFLYNADSFKKLQYYIIFLQLTAMLIYILFPSRQDLRPELFPRDNIFSRIVALLYALDSNTGVCPSLHCAISIGIASVWLKTGTVSKAAKLAVTLLCLLICMSTLFIKQHSFLDFIAALPLCAAAEVLIFHKRRPKLT